MQCVNARNEVQVLIGRKISKRAICVDGAVCACDALSPTEVSPIQREAVDRSIYCLKFML